MKERIATEGKWLTEASLENEESRTFAKKVSGYADLDSLFVEWTDAQKIEWEEIYKTDNYGLE